MVECISVECDVDGDDVCEYVVESSRFKYVSDSCSFGVEDKSFIWLVINKAVCVEFYGVVDIRWCCCPVDVVFIGLFSLYFVILSRCSSLM